MRETRCEGLAHLDIREVADDGCDSARRAVGCRLYAVAGRVAVSACSPVQRGRRMSTTKMAPAIAAKP